MEVFQESLCMVAIQSLAELNRWQEVVPYVTRVYNGIEDCPEKIVQAWWVTGHLFTTDELQSIQVDFSSKVLLNRVELAKYYRLEFKCSKIVVTDDTGHLTLELSCTLAIFNRIGIISDVHGCEIEAF